VRKAEPASALDHEGAPISSAPDKPRAFTREQRLTTPAQFRGVFAEPLRSTDRYFTLLARPSPATSARLGLTISRRSAKRAVDRNKLKRLARESFRHQRLPAWDFVVIAKPGAAAADKQVLRASLDAHFKRLTGPGTAR